MPTRNLLLNIPEQVFSIKVRDFWKSCLTPLKSIPASSVLANVNIFSSLMKEALESFKSTNTYRFLCISECFLPLNLCLLSPVHMLWLDLWEQMIYDLHLCISTSICYLSFHIFFFNLYDILGVLPASSVNHFWIICIVKSVSSTKGNFILAVLITLILFQSICHRSLVASLETLSIHLMLSSTRFLKYLSGKMSSGSLTLQYLYCTVIDLFILFLQVTGLYLIGFKWRKTFLVSGLGNNQIIQISFQVFALASVVVVTWRPIMT